MCRAVCQQVHVDDDVDVTGSHVHFASSEALGNSKDQTWALTQGSAHMQRWVGVG